MTSTANSSLTVPRLSNSGSSPPHSAFTASRGDGDRMGEGMLPRTACALHGTAPGTDSARVGFEPHCRSRSWQAACSICSRSSPPFDYYLHPGGTRFSDRVSAAEQWKRRASRGEDEVLGRKSFLPTKRGSTSKGTGVQG